MEGLRIKIKYHNIRRLCTNCYGKHLRKDCTGSKKTWSDYIKKFASDYPELPKDFYGKWNASNAKLRCPDHADCKLPTNQEELDAMLKKLEECGIDRDTRMESIRKRKDAYAKALKEYKMQTQSNLNDES